MSQTPEQLAAVLADARANREAIQLRLDADIREALIRVLPVLRSAVEEEAVAEQALLEIVTDQGAAEYPKGKRSQTGHGIVWGYAKAPDTIEVDDHGRSVAAARAAYSSAEANAIIKTVETIRLDAVAGWTTDDLATIHARRVTGVDRPFVRAGANDVEKLVRAIGNAALKQAAKTQEAA